MRHLIVQVESSFVLGRPSNGWDDWKDADGKKLSEIIKR